MKTATIYKLSDPADLSKIDAMPAIEEPTAFTLQSVGRMDIGDNASYAIGNSGAWYRFRIYKTNISSSANKREQAKRITASMDKAQRAQIKQSIIDELGAKTPANHVDIDVAFSGEYLVIGAGEKQALEITKVIRDELGSLRITPYPEAFSLKNCVLPMINNGQLEVGSIRLEGDIKAEFGDDGDLTRKSKSFNSDALEIFRDCIDIKHVRVGWGDITATVKQDGALSSIKSDVDIDAADGEDDGNLQRLAEVTYLADQLPKMMGDLCLQVAQ